MEEQRKTDASQAALEQAQQLVAGSDQPPQVEAVTKLLKALPGLVGAIDQAIIAEAGIRPGFVLLIFAEGGAMHATNINPPATAITAIQQLAESWKQTPPKSHTQD